MISDSGEHKLDLELRDTEPCVAPADPEVDKPTWPKLKAVRLELTTDLLNGEEIER